MGKALEEASGGLNQNRLAEYGAMVEKCLSSLMHLQRNLRLEQAMRHCLCSGGKRLRPILTLVAAESLAVAPEVALRPACALEMIHTASLVLDDLPCMDDAKERRGVPACHVSFGEDIAILAAVTLITESFQVVTDSPELTDTQKVRICSIISDALGAQGLAAGQESDLRDMEAYVNVAKVETMEQNKTSALFVACVRIAGVLGGLTEEATSALREFGKRFGLAFQIFDDLLDSLGSSAKTGKDHKQDKGRATFITVMSPSEAEARALSELREGLRVLETVGIKDSCFDLLIQTLFDSYRAQVG